MSDKEMRKWDYILWCLDVQGSPVIKLFIIDIDI